MPNAGNVGGPHRRPLASAVCRRWLAADSVVFRRTLMVLGGVHRTTMDAGGAHRHEPAGGTGRRSVAAHGISDGMTLGPYVKFIELFTIK